MAVSNSSDPRVRTIQLLTQQLAMNAQLTPELQAAIAELNAAACKNFNRNQPKPPRKHA